MTRLTLLLAFAGLAVALLVGAGLARAGTTTVAAANYDYDDSATFAQRATGSSDPVDGLVNVRQRGTSGASCAARFRYPGRLAAKGFGNLTAGIVREGHVLPAAERWLGPGYREIAPGVYRSADNTRQFRMTASDLGAKDPHVHFESVGPNGREITENVHVYIR